VSTKCN